MLGLTGIMALSSLLPVPGGSLQTSHLLSLRTSPEGATYLVERGGRTWTVDLATGDLTRTNADPSAPKTIPGVGETLWPGYRKVASLHLVADRESVGEFFLPRIRAVDAAGKLLARSKPAIETADPLRIDARGRAHWRESSVPYDAKPDWTWVRYDPSTGRTERRHVGTRAWPISVSPDGEVLVVETAEFADGAYALIPFAGKPEPLPKFKGKGCDAVFTESGELLALRGEQTLLPVGLSLEGFLFRLFRLDPKTRTWTPIPLKP